MQGYTPEQLIKILKQYDWQPKRKNGSHITLENIHTHQTITVPDHRHELCRPMTRRLLKDANLLNVLSY